MHFLRACSSFELGESTVHHEISSRAEIVSGSPSHGIDGSGMMEHQFIATAEKRFCTEAGGGRLDKAVKRKRLHDIDIEELASDGMAGRICRFQCILEAVVDRAAFSYGRHDEELPSPPKIQSSGLVAGAPDHTAKTGRPPVAYHAEARNPFEFNERGHTSRHEHPACQCGRGCMVR